MKKFALLAVLLLLVTVELSAQKSAIYMFQGNFEEKNKQGPILQTLGLKGKFITEALPELGNAQSTVYKFDKNCGLLLKTNELPLQIKDQYSIEMYFRFDALDSWKRVIDFKNRTTDEGAYIFNGQLNFYNLINSDEAPVVAGQYTHYVITRDRKTKLVKIYADGLGEISFTDVNDMAVVSADNELHFFYDDLKVNNEASSGAVAYIKLYDYVLSEKEALITFNQLATTVESTKSNTTITSNTNTTTTTETKKTGSTTFLCFDAETKQPIEAKLSCNGKQLSGSNMELKDIEANKSYEFTVSATGYQSLSNSFSVPTFDKPSKHSIYLKPIKQGSTIQLENVLFVRGLPELLPSSLPVLDQLAKMLIENPNMEIELRGHTDNQGNPGKNIILSKERVNAVKDYLVSKGADPARIQGVGLGGQEPIAPNDTEENRQKNRRVEFKVLKI